eukprot:14831783-Alexandrium_andersonii.AAC.1
MVATPTVRRSHAQPQTCIQLHCVGIAQRRWTARVSLSFPTPTRPAHADAHSLMQHVCLSASTA